MSETRFATPNDSELIAQHRRQMFLDAGQPDDHRMAAMFRNFLPWIRRELEHGRYIGWLASPQTDTSQIIGGAGLWLMEFPPHFLQLEPVRAYLLNFYVDPAFRGQGLARSLLHAAMEEARRRRVEVITLHASKFGRPLYQQTGFKPTNEMMLRFDANTPDRTVS